MQLTLPVSISLLLALTSAQTLSITSSAGSSSACAALPVLDACLASTEAIATACATTDYGCLCEKYTDVLTCFNQCPNDPRLASRQNLQQIHCANAKTYASSTQKPISSDHPATTTTSTEGSASRTAGSDDVRVASTSTSSTGPTNSPNAGSVVVRNSGVVLGLLGVGLVL